MFRQVRLDAIVIRPKISANKKERPVNIVAHRAFLFGIGSWSCPFVLYLIAAFPTIP